MKCVRCGYESPAPFSQCPYCGTVQNPPQYASPYQTAFTSNGSQYGGAKRTGGETAAIVIAVVVSVLSVIAAFIILIAYSSNAASKTMEEYGIDAADDFDSNEYEDDELEKFFKDYYGKDNRYTSETPAGLNTPISFKTELYSFSEGEVQTEYEVSMTAAYRGEAALKMLEGAALPTYDKDKYDIYLARFSVRITEQDKDAIVTLPMSHPAAYPSNNVSLFSSDYKALGSLQYVNQYSLITKGETVETYIAFIVEKDDKSPCIRWDLSEDKVFRDEEEAVSDASAVEAGSAIEKPNEETEAASEDASSN